MLTSFLESHELATFSPSLLKVVTVVLTALFSPCRAMHKAHFACLLLCEVFMLLRCVPLTVSSDLLKHFSFFFAAQAAGCMFPVLGFRDWWFFWQHQFLKPVHGLLTVGKSYSFLSMNLWHLGTPHGCIFANLFPISLISAFCCSFLSFVHNRYSFSSFFSSFLSFFSHSRSVYGQNLSLCIPFSPTYTHSV